MPARESLQPPSSERAVQSAVLGDLRPYPQTVQMPQDSVTDTSPLHPLIGKRSKRELVEVELGNGRVLPRQKTSLTKQFSNISSSSRRILPIYPSSQSHQSGSPPPSPLLANEAGRNEGKGSRISITAGEQGVPLRGHRHQGVVVYYM